MAKAKKESKRADAGAVVAVVLAAGKGTRMKSALPKVLHKVAGVPILENVLRATKGLGESATIVVLNPDVERFSGLRQSEPHVSFAIQEKQKGTADAVAAAAAALTGVTEPAYSEARLWAGKKIDAKAYPLMLICTGDTPCLTSETLSAFLDEFRVSKASFGVVGVKIPNPHGYGRLILDAKGELKEIIEERDASAKQRKIDVINSGIIAAKTVDLFEALSAVKPDNDQKEYYLTSIFSIARKKKQRTFVYETSRWQEFVGVNDRVQLSDAESFLVREKCAALQRSGVTIQMPSSVYIERDVVIEPETVIEPGVAIFGQTKIGGGCRIGSHSTLRDCVVLNGVSIRSGSVVENK